VILDVMMPKLDGISVVKRLREKGNNVPVLILTAKSEIDDRVLGLDSGADDYLTKPFAMKELLARIRAMYRRKNEVINNYSFGNMILNPKNFEIKSGEGTIRLTNKEYQMLEMLISNPNCLISTEKFMENIWGFNSESEINVVWVYISAIRKKLKAIGSNVNIKAVRGVGYKLEEKYD
ncbi:MAG: response regulator transcription factor, partial [Clostridia bacterium]